MNCIRIQQHGAVGGNLVRTSFSTFRGAIGGGEGGSREKLAHQLQLHHFALPGEGEVTLNDLPEECYRLQPRYCTLSRVHTHTNTQSQ